MMRANVVPTELGTSVGRRGHVAEMQGRFVAVVVGAAPAATPGRVPLVGSSLDVGVRPWRKFDESYFGPAVPWPGAIWTTNGLGFSTTGGDDNVQLVNGVFDLLGQGSVGMNNVVRLTDASA